MNHETAFTMDTSSIKFGPGSTREVGHDLKRLGAQRVMVVTDAQVAKLEPLGENKVKILEHHRKHKGKEVFKRVEAEEGVVLPFAQLKLTESYDELFPLPEAA